MALQFPVIALPASFAPSLQHQITGHQDIGGEAVRLPFGGLPLVRFPTQDGGLGRPPCEERHLRSPVRDVAPVQNPVPDFVPHGEPVAAPFARVILGIETLIDVDLARSQMLQTAGKIEAS